MPLKIKIKKIDDKATLPVFAYEGDAGFDLFASENVILKPGERTAIKTGIMMEIPMGYVGLIWDKSGVAMKRGLRSLGGVVDAGYRGEIMVGMINLDKEEQAFTAGDKIAQMLVQERQLVEIEEVETLSDAERGDKGFGSSGK